MWCYTLVVENMEVVTTLVDLDPWVLTIEFWEGELG
jgi:hypothetical protein